MTDIETIIVGGGQAGLAVSHLLSRVKREHLVLERGSVANAWRTQRWDSFRLVTPNAMCNLPGWRYDGPDPRGFMPRAEIVRHFERYVAVHRPPLRLGVGVTRLSTPGDRRFVIESDAGALTSRNVVVATGPFQTPQLPSFCTRLSPELMQISSQSYRNSQHVPDGAVLVVGTGQSGVQIAEELVRSGRRTFLSVGTRGWLPRRYFGRDITDWYVDMGLMDMTVDAFENLASARASGFAQLAGDDKVGHDTNVHTLAEKGVTLLGRAVDGEGHSILFRQRAVSIRRADDFATQAKARIDAHIAEMGVKPVDADAWPRYRPIEGDGPQSLDLRAEGIRCIVWAIGYRVAFDWVKIPVLDASGYPQHRRGITLVPGLYFTGLEWLHRRRSSLLFVGEEDAQYIVDSILEADT